MSGLRIRIDETGYRGRPVLKDVDVAEIPPGSLVALLGPNAAGKSTLLKAIMGLVAYRGVIALGGQDLARLPRAGRVREVAYLPQSLPQQTPLVAYEAVLSAVRATRPEFARAEAEAAVERVFADLGIRALALRPLSQMSGGQRQMVGLAQVMAREPRLMLLDEPTSALDLHWQMDVIGSVRAATAKRNAIAVMAVHDINLAIRSCDFVVVLAEGRVIAQGRPGTVLDAGILRRAYAVEARIETCSRGTPFVLIDRAASREPA